MSNAWPAAGNRGSLSDVPSGGTYCVFFLTSTRGGSSPLGSAKRALEGSVRKRSKGPREVIPRKEPHRFGGGCGVLPNSPEPHGPTPELPGGVRRQARAPPR